MFENVSVMTMYFTITIINLNIFIFRRKVGFYDAKMYWEKVLSFKNGTGKLNEFCFMPILFIEICKETKYKSMV